MESTISTVLPLQATYPLSSHSTLQQHFVGQDLRDVETPAAVVDRAVVRRNCNLMLDAARRHKFKFRAHVKTHKTLEVTQMQIGGDDARDIRLVVSTVLELEQLFPWLVRCKEQGKSIDVIYGVPSSRDQIGRLRRLATDLGVGCISVLVDNVDQLAACESSSAHPGKLGLFIKIDTGYHRAGVEVPSAQFDSMVGWMTKTSHHGYVLRGLYSHLGHSYGFNTPQESFEGLVHEFSSLVSAAERLSTCVKISEKLILTAGATPTATSLQPFEHPEKTGPFNELRTWQERYDLELHAGVYPFLDLQQLATHARIPHAPDDPSNSYLSLGNLALCILVEVRSVYTGRSKPEALIGAGTLALGREPCKSYPGWAIVSPWAHHTRVSPPPIYTEEARTGWIVGRIAQEHGILTWEGPPQECHDLRYGQKLLLWPNHACVAGACFGWYLVRDSESDNPDIIRDVWVRWRGW